MKNKLLDLMWSFFKIGLFTFGGGYAMIALLESEFVGKKNWIEKDEFLDMVAIAESTPGPIAINAATYIGYNVSGVLGAVCATVSICIPSLVIIYVISLFFDSFLGLEIVAKAFAGIRVCVIYLIAKAGIKLFKGLKKNALNICLFIAILSAFVAFSFLSVSFSSIFFIIIGGVVGVVAYGIRSMRERSAR